MRTVSLIVIAALSAMLTGCPPSPSACARVRYAVPPMSADMIADASPTP